MKHALQLPPNHIDEHVQLCVSLNRFVAGLSGRRLDVSEMVVLHHLDVIETRIQRLKQLL